MEPFIWVLSGVALLLYVGVAIGVMLCNRQTADEQARLADLERRLQAEWDALERTQRINEAYWLARTALRDEALRHRHPNVFRYEPPR